MINQGKVEQGKVEQGKVEQGKVECLPDHLPRTPVRVKGKGCWRVWLREIR